MKRINMLLLVLLFTLGCANNNRYRILGRFTKKEINSKAIHKDSVEISLYLYDVRDNTAMSIDDITKIPGDVVAQSFNHKLLRYHKDAIPQSIVVGKKDKSAIILYPQKHKKNLVIYRLYLGHHPFRII